MIDKYTKDGHKILELHCDKDLCLNHKVLVDPSPLELQDTDWVSETINYPEEEDKDPKVLNLYCPKHAKERYS